MRRTGGRRVNLSCGPGAGVLSAVVVADGAAAIRAGEMTDAYNGVTLPVGPTEEHVEKAAFSVLDIAAQGVGTKVGHLDHARELAVDEERGFDDMVNIGPEGAAGLE